MQSKIEAMLDITSWFSCVGITFTGTNCYFSKLWHWPTCDALRLRAVVAFVCSQLDLLPEWLALASVPSGLALACASPTWLAITGGLDWRLLFHVRVPGHSLSVSASVRPCPALSTYHVVRQMQLQHATDLQAELVWPTLTKTVRPHTVVLAHLYPGCRKEGFFLKHAVQQGLSRGLDVRVLLIDLEPSNHYDMLDDKKFQQIWEHMPLGSFWGLADSSRWDMDCKQHEDFHWHGQFCWLKGGASCWCAMARWWSDDCWAATGRYGQRFAVCRALVSASLPVCRGSFCPGACECANHSWIAKHMDNMAGAVASSAPQCAAGFSAS